MLVIPAIDLIDGQLVRLKQGDYAQKTVYSDSPVKVAKTFEEKGFTHLHLVDLDGAKAGKVVNLKVLESIAQNTSLKVDFGGGIKSQKDLEAVLQAGAHQVTIGSLAVKNEPLLSSWIAEFGSDRFILAADCKDEKISVGGWLEQSDLSVFDFIERYKGKGIRNFLCTDIARDGMFTGPATDLYGKILQKFPEIYLIASGGIRDINDLSDCSSKGCSASVVGKALYEKRIDLDELATTKL